MNVLEDVLNDLAAFPWLQAGNSRCKHSIKTLRYLCTLSANKVQAAAEYVLTQQDAPAAQCTPQLPALQLP